jgi:MFS transporter, DHA2 family, multidrug resistance protein
LIFKECVVIESLKSDRKGLILAVMCLAVFLVVVDNTIVNVALPTLSRSLHASNSALQWIVDGYSLPFAGLLLAGGGLSDRFGRRRVMMTGLAFFGLFSLAAAFSTSTGTLLAARALMGVSAAFIFPATLSILTVTFSDASERAKAFGIWGATSGLAVAFGPLVGGALIVHFWYGSIFLVNVPIVVLTLLAAWRVVPESSSPQLRRYDPVGLVLGTAGVTALVLAIIEGPGWGWTGTTTLVIFAAAAALLVAFARYELRRTEPLLDVRIFRVPAFSAGAISIAVTFFALFGFIFLMTQYFQLVRGYSAFSAGLHTLPFAIVSMLITPLGAVAALRVGARIVVPAGLAIMAVGLVWVGTISASSSYFGPVILSMIVLAFGFSLITAPSTAAVMSSLDPGQIGAGAAVNNTTRELGGTLGVAVLGSIFSSRFIPAIAAAFRSAPLTSAQLHTAQSSMQAALVTGRALPASARASVFAHIDLAFMDGLHMGCFVAAGVLVTTAAVAALLLPRATATAATPSLVEAMAH